MMFFPSLGIRGQTAVVDDRGVKVALAAVFRDAAHECVRHVGPGSHFATIAIDGERGVALVGQVRGLLFPESFSPQY
jgi:hypothetical protein